MAATAENLSSEKSSPAEEWTIVLPRRGKKNRSFRNSGVPIEQKEELSWTPTDMEEDPERESKLMRKMQICLQKLEVSDFFSSFLDQMQNPDMLNRFLKVLGSEEKMQMVIYGIGSIESFESPRFQLSLAILMKRNFSWMGEIEVFDPIISLTESNVLNSLGCFVLAVNEQGRRQVRKPTLFFMPHCEANLYENLLEVNWVMDRLNRLVLFGNNFGSYEQLMSLCKNLAVPNSRKHMLAVKKFSEEFEIKTFSDDSFRAFHGSSWHFFSPATEAELEL